MIRHHWVSTYRVLSNNKTFLLINTICLIISFTSIILISGFISFEKNYDNFHEDANNIYRITSSFTESGHQYIKATSPGATGSYLKENFHGINAYVEVSTKYGPQIFNFKEEKFFGEYYYATAGLMEVFTFNFIEGDGSRLSMPNSCIISVSKSNLWFKGDSPIGKEIQTHNGAVNIVGVYEDYPKNSHFKPDMIVRAYDAWNIEEGWKWPSYHTYVKTSKDFDSRQFEMFLDDANENMFFPAISKYRASVTASNLYFQRLQSVHLSPNREWELEPAGNPQYVSNMFWVAILVLIVTIINFNNLVFVQFQFKLRELGIKMIMGSDRKEIVASFALIPLTIILISMAVTVVAIESIFYFKNFVIFDLYWTKPFISFYVLSTLIFTLVTLPVSAIQFLIITRKKPPVLLLSNKIGYNRRKALPGRNIFIVLQFTASSFLIASTFGMYKQNLFISNYSLGLNPNQVVATRLDNNSRDMKLFQERLDQYPDILSTGNSTYIPGQNPTTENIEIRTPNGRITKHIIDVGIDKGFVETLEIELTSGRNINNWVRDSAYLEVLVNEAFVETYGLTDPIGLTFESNTFSDGLQLNAKIIGVVRDFHFSNLHEKIGPMIFSNSGGFFLLIKLSAKNIKKSLALLNELNFEITGTKDVELVFLDDHLAQQYKSDLERNKLFLLFTIVAVVIACLGLFAISAQSIISKSKETAIRKILGTTTGSLTIRYLGNFSLLTSLGFLISIPLVNIYLDRWLSTFAYKTTMGLLDYVFALGLLFMISSLTVLYNSHKAAEANPAEALKVKN